MAREAREQRPVILSVFMEGTSNPIEPVTTQLGLFAKACQATQLDNQQLKLPRVQPGHYKLCFDGCGVTNGFWGVVIAAGLQEQCQLICNYVREFYKMLLDVEINFVGASRGGIGGLYLAQELEKQKFSLESVRLNLLLFDPVPGDFVWISRYLDVLGRSNANQTMDISHVTNLGRVLVLYPHEPLPSIAVHAPLIPKFPKDCDIEWDVILGCHQGALFLRPAADTCLTFFRISEFLRAGGIRFNLADHPLSLNLHLLKDILNKELEDSTRPTERFVHSSEGRWDIVRYEKGQYLCRSHQELLRRTDQPCELAKEDAAGESLPPYMLDFRPI